MNPAVLRRSVIATRRGVMLIALGLLALFCADASRAPASVTIYGSVYTSGGLATLYTIDSTTGAGTVIGTGMGFKQVGAIDLDPVSGTLYGIGRRAGGNASVLITISTTTGVGTEVGPTGLTENVSDISFRSDGSLFALDRTAAFFSISTLSGGATFIGYGNNAIISQGDALAFSPGDVLYRATATPPTLRTKDPSTADETEVATMDYSPLTSQSDVPRPNGMDFEVATGILWASIKSNSANYLATIDTSNGDVSYVGTTVAGLDALAVAAVPEPGHLALFGIGAVVVLARRRRG